MNFLAVLITLVIAIPGCKAEQETTTPLTFSRVFFVPMENRDYAEVIGSASMPYLNSLANQYGLATNYFANTHPSIGNYFMLTTGKVLTNNSDFNEVVSDNNLARQLIAANVSWGVFAESLPSVGYIGGNTGQYVKRHNPFAYFSDVRNNAAEAGRIIPYSPSDFTSLLSGNTLPRFVYVLPNQQSNMHDCPPTKPFNCGVSDRLSYGDKWLKDNLTPILSDSEFIKNGLLILAFDEATEDDTDHGGGKVAFVLISGRSKPSYKSTRFYQHQNTLRLICDSLGLNNCPGASVNASSMQEFFNPQ